MFYWMKGSSGGSEDPDRLAHMSKSDILRGIVRDKLSTAAREIFAVVERTVAGYEEEAAGLRREVDRQRKQLDVILQPRVSLQRPEVLVQDEAGPSVVVLSEEHPKHKSGLEDTGSLSMWWEDEEDGDGDEEQQLSESLITPSSRQRKEDLKDPDFQITPRVQSGRRKPGRPRLSDSQDHLDLKIRILRGSQTAVLSNRVFPTCPLQDLRCPRGMKEPDFLDLLRSTFPQLVRQEPLEFFTSDRSRRLLPLSVATLTPEEICRSIRLSGAGKSTLYIRGQTGDSGEDVLLRGDESTSSARVSSPRVLSERRRRGRPRLGEEPTQLRLRVCVLEAWQRASVPCAEDMIKSPLQELSCPRGLQEDDFLALLRSTFPQLANQKAFHMFTSDRSRRLRRLHVQTTTPDEIFRSCTGAERPVLYLRIKTGEEEEEEQEEQEEEEEEQEEEEQEEQLHRPQNSHTDFQSTSDLQIKTDSAGLTSSSTAGTQVDSSELRDQDWKPDPDQSRPKRRRVAISKNPCRVCGVWYRSRSSLIKHGWTHVDEAQRVCGVCGRTFDSSDEFREHLRSYQKTHDCSFCGKSFVSAAGLEQHATRHTGSRPFKCDTCSKTFAQRYALSRHVWVHAAHKPHRCELCPKAFGLKAALRAHSRTHAGDGFTCTLCGKSLSDRRCLLRHRATHSGERRHGCQVCGKRFKLVNTLKAHEKTHTPRERLFLCHVCCKSFFSNCSLKAHMRTHSGERPFTCSVCGKGFISNGELKVHARVHTGEAPYGCSQCGRFFKRKTHLSSHLRSHLGLKLFVCSVCGKACSRQEHLNVHMRTHNGERPYQCSLCEKAFTQGHCLKTHMKSHQQENLSLNAPSS